MIYSIVTMIIEAGRMEEFLGECKKVRPLVLSENGCLMYDYTREIETDVTIQEEINMNRITLYEKWESKKALDIHNTMPYMDEFVMRVAPMRISISIRTGIEAF